MGRLSLTAIAGTQRVCYTLLVGLPLYTKNALVKEFSQDATLAVEPHHLRLEAVWPPVRGESPMLMLQNSKGKQHRKNLNRW